MVTDDWDVRSTQQRMSLFLDWSYFGLNIIGDSTLDRGNIPSTLHHEVSSGYTVMTGTYIHGSSARETLVPAPA